MTDSTEGRPPIAERAEVRDRMDRSGRDRYSSLVRALQAGREVPIGRTRETRLEWHPVAWQIVKVALVVAVAYIVGVNAYGWWRERQVDTWTGPPGIAVQSGQRLDGCAATQGIVHDTLPTWVRYDGQVYVLTDALWAIRRQSRPNETGLVETGYTLGGMRILLIDAPAANAAVERLVVANPPAYAGGYYVSHPECA